MGEGFTDWLQCCLGGGGDPYAGFMSQLGAQQLFSEHQRQAQFSQNLGLAARNPLELYALRGMAQGAGNRLGATSTVTQPGYGYTFRWTTTERQEPVPKSTRRERRAARKAKLRRAFLDDPWRPEPVRPLAVSRLDHKLNREMFPVRPWYWPLCPWWWGKPSNVVF